MSSKKLGIIICLVVFVVIILFLVLRGVTIKKTTETEAPVNEVQMQTQQRTQSIAVDQNVLNENTGTTNLAEALLSNKDVSKNSSTTPDSELNLVRKSEVNLISEDTQDVLISSKDIYLTNTGSYAYSISMILPVQGTYRVVNYLCSVKTWNSLESGQSISVTYGIDEAGNVLIEGLEVK